MSDKIQIAIDGPAVSGKSSAAKRLAKRLDYLYLDSGAVYRAITLAKLRELITQNGDLRSKLDALNLRLTPDPSGMGCRVQLKGEDVSTEIRGEKVTQNILPVSGDVEVREWVTDYLRSAAAESDVVMDGRDIASVVFPNANFKFYVTASIEARAKRRLSDINSAEENLESMMADIEKRDDGDRKREVGPLVQVPEATVIDNTELDLDATVEKMYVIVKGT